MTNIYFFASIFLLVALVLALVWILLLHVQKKKTAQSEKQESSPIYKEVVSTDKDEELFQRLKALMEDQQLYHEAELQRDDLAARLHTNRTYLTRAVKLYADGQSITDFVNGYRLREAIMLLENEPEWGIGQVAKEVGFNSRETFNRLFKKQCGMTPTEYRAQLPHQDQQR